MTIISSKGKDTQPFLEIVAKLNLSCLSTTSNLAFANMIMQAKLTPEQELDLGALPKLIFELLDNPSVENIEEPDIFKNFLKQVFEINPDEDEEEWTGYSITEQLLLSVGDEPAELYSLQQAISSVLNSYSPSDQDQFPGLKEYKNKLDKLLQQSLKQQLNTGGIEVFKKIMIAVPGLVSFLELDQLQLSRYLFACHRYAQQIFANSDLDESVRISLLDPIVEVCIRLADVTDLELIEQGNTILQLVAKATDFADADLIKALVTNGADFEKVDITGQSAFELFLSNYNALGVGIIIEHGNYSKLETEINAAAQNFNLQFLVSLIKIIPELELEDNTNLNKVKVRVKLAVQQVASNLELNPEEIPNFKTILDALYNASSAFEHLLFVEILAFMRTHYGTEAYAKIADELGINDYWASPFSIAAESLAFFSVIKGAVTEKAQQAVTAVQPMVERLRS